MNHSQRLIAEEAAKYGAKKVSKLDAVADVVNQSIEEASTKPVYRAGDKVQVPFNGKMVTGKVVRFDSGGTDKARQHGGGYVVDVGQRGSVLIPAHLVRAMKKEEVEQVDENNKDFYNYRLVVAGKIVAKGSERAMMLRAKKHGGLSKGGVEILRPGEKLKKEEVEQTEDITEARWKKVDRSFDSEKEAEKWLTSRGWKFVNVDRETGYRSFRKGRSSAFIHVDTTMDVTVQIKEEVEGITEAFSIGTKSYEIQRDQFSKKEEYVLYRLSYGTGSVRFSDGRRGTPIGNYKSKQEAMAAAKKDAGVKEEVEHIVESVDEFLDDMEKAYKKGGLKAMVSTGGSSLRDEMTFMDFVQNLSRYMKGVPPATMKYIKKEIVKMVKPADLVKIAKYVKEDIEQVDEAVKNYVCFYNRKQIVVQASSSYEAQQKAGAAFKVPPKKQYMIAVKLAEATHFPEEVEEAYAPSSVDLKSIAGAFTEKSGKKRFEYRMSQDSWGKSHGLPHEVWVSENKGGKGGMLRAANVKGTVCIIATDEGADGKPVLDKWAITNHVKYVKAESVEVAEAKDGGLMTNLTHPKGKAVVTKSGKVVAIYRTERAARKHAMTGKPVKEDVEMTEAVSMKEMGFKKWTGGGMSFRVGRLEGVSANQLIKVFGPPHSKGSSDDKTTMEWGFINQNGLIFTVYDYKNPPKSMSAPHNWSVGGTGDKQKISIQRAFKMMGVPGKMIREEMEFDDVVEAYDEKSHGKFKAGDKVVSKSSGVKGTIVRFEPSAKGFAAVIKTEKGTTLTSSVSNIQHVGK